MCSEHTSCANSPQGHHWLSRLSIPARRKAGAGRRRAASMGRPPKLTPQQQREARRRRAQGKTFLRGYLYPIRQISWWDMLCRL